MTIQSLSTPVHSSTCSKHEDARVVPRRGRGKTGKPILNASTIEVVEYNPLCAVKFSQEESLLQHVIGNNALAIVHIGSTAVPELAAKPIIDILLTLVSLEELTARHDPLFRHGYIAKGENGISGRRYFQKSGSQRTFHVHAFEQHDPQLVRHLACRDYLIAFPEVALQYQQVKQYAALVCQHNPNHYAELKNSFIQQHEQSAIAWFDKQ